MSYANLAFQLLGYIGLAALLIYPVRQIFRRAGLNPDYGFLIFFPFAGLFIVSGVLALAPWPASHVDAADDVGLN